MRFRFNWKDGSHEEVEMSDCSTVDEAINSRCGSSLGSLESCAIVAEIAEVAPEVAVKPEEQP